MNENSLELFSLLSDTPQVSKEEMQNAYKHLSIKQEHIDLYYKNKPRIFATVPVFPKLKFHVRVATMVWEALLKLSRLKGD